MVRDNPRFQLNGSIYEVFAWARAHRAAHKEGAFPRNRDEPRDPAGTARWRDRLFDSIALTSFEFNTTRRVKWDTFLLLPRCPAVAADTIDNNVAYVECDMGDASPDQIIIAFMDYVVEPSERNRARNDLSNAKIRQDTHTMEHLSLIHI